jgi:glycosyltransferase involved in cell wall biosynthesis
MRILHLLGDRRLPQDPDTASSSGVVRAALELAQAQSERDHDVTVTAVGSESWERRWRGVRLMARRSASWAQATIGGRSLDLRTHLAYAFYAARLRPDVLHAHNYYYLRGLPARRRVVHFHADPLYQGARGVRTDFSAADFALVARTTDLQIGNSRYVTGQIQRGIGPAGRVHTVYCGVDHARFTGAHLAEEAARLRAAWGAGPDDPVVLYAGALVPEKGVLHLARAYQRLPAEAARLVLAGGRTLWGGAVRQEDVGGYDRQVLQVLAAGITAGHVQHLGNVPASQMPAVYAAADILVVPSVWPEAFGLVALEGAASGLPVIASATGGLRETVTPESGIEVPPGDEDALLAAIRALVDDPARRRRMGEAGCAHAATFTWTAAAEQLDHLYLGPATFRRPEITRSTA